MMYAELIGNYKKQRIKSLCDNIKAYVEFGHRTRGHKSWVSGQYMLTRSVNEVEAIKDKIVNKHVAKALGGLFDDK